MCCAARVTTTTGNGALAHRVGLEREVMRDITALTTLGKKPVAVTENKHQATSANHEMIKSAPTGPNNKGNPEYSPYAWV